MDLLEKLDRYRDEASWAVWKTDGTGRLTGDMEFPLGDAPTVAHGRAMIVALNPGGTAPLDGPTTPSWSNFHNPHPRHNDAFLAHAFVGTPLWGAYMADLHPEVVESNSTLVRPEDEVVLLAVQSLIAQGELLGSVDAIVCLGAKAHESVARHAGAIEQALGVRSILRIPHYSRSNAGVHKHDAERYRALVHEQIA